MADSNKLLLLGAAGVAVWWFYFRTPAPAAAPVVGAPAPTGGTNPPATTGGGSAATPPAAAKPSMATIQARVLADANLPAGGKLTVDQWGWYLNNELSAAGLPAAPDPMPIFSAAWGGAFDRSTPLDVAQYWVNIAPALHGQPYGLSGYGLAGLGLYMGTR